MATNDDFIGNDITEASLTWDKFAAYAKKAGFRDGAADGRSTVYQKSFDEGYIQGFQNGFAIGKYKGALRAEHVNSQLVQNDSHLDNSKRGWCQICQNEELLQCTTDEITNKQKEFSNNLLGKLHAKYSCTTSVALQNKLE